MSTIAADPLALMPRGDAVAGPVAAPVAGDGADFALTLADVMGAGALPAASSDTPVGEMPVAAVTTEAQADAAEMGPLKMLEGMARIVLPTAPVGVAQAAERAVEAVPAGGDQGEVIPAQPAPEVAEVVPGVAQAVDPAAIEGAVAPVATDVAGEVALPPGLAVQPAPESEDGAVEAGEEASTEESEVPVSEVAEAVTVAVAAVIAAPLAVATGTATAESPKQDGAAEAVRLAGAAPLMAAPAKGRKAEGVTPEKGQAKDAAEGDGEAEGVKSSKEDKDKTAETKVTARVAQMVPEAAAKPMPDKRAETVVPVVETVRAAEGTTTAAPQMQTSQPLTAQPATPAPVAMDRPGWETALTERIAAELSEDGQQIELDLAPERLGGLKITLEISDGQAQVRFVTETPEAARLIQQNEHRLSESLSRAGLSLGGHESASRDSQQQQGDRSGRGAPRGLDIAFQRPAEPRPGMISGRAGSGLVNLIA